MVAVGIDNDKDIFIDQADSAGPNLAVGAPIVDSLDGRAVEDTRSEVETEASPAQVLVALDVVPLKSTGTPSYTLVAYKGQSGG